MSAIYSQECSTADKGLFSLSTREDISSLRHEFLRKLLHGHWTETNTLEIVSGQEKLHNIISFNAIESVSAAQFFSSTAPDIESKYSQIIWFNGLNWARPYHACALKKVISKLAEGATLLLSCATHFFFLDESPFIERALADKLRQEQGLPALKHDFNQMRFGLQELRGLLFGLHLARYEHIEVDVSLEFEAFNAWHEGSLKTLFGDTEDQFASLSEQFIIQLYEMYKKRTYQPKLGTTLISLTNKEL